MRQYQVGDTPYIRVIHQTYNLATDTWTDANPDEGFPKITIKDPDGVIKINAVTMSKKANGKFEYLYTIPSDAKGGWWRIFVDVENGGYPDTEASGFNVTSKG